MSINKSNVIALVVGVIALVVGVILGAVFSGGSNEASDLPAATVSSSTFDDRESYTVEMSNAAKSEPINLVGDYSVEWQTISGDCEKTDVSLRAAWETNYGFYGTVFNYDGYGQGTSYFYTLDAGNYYLEADGIWSDTCSWKATFTPVVP